MTARSALAAESDRPADAKGIALTPLQREFSDGGVTYPHVRVSVRSGGAARRRDAARAVGCAAWRCGGHACGRCGILAARTGARAGRRDAASAAERTDAGADRTAVGGRSGGGACASTNCWRRIKDDWLVREIRLYLKRVFKRVDMTSRSVIALVEPGSCFAGTLAELLFAADRSVMFAGTRQRRQSRSGARASLDVEFRCVSDGQWADAARDAISRRGRQFCAGARARGRDVGCG